MADCHPSISRPAELRAREKDDSGSVYLEGESGISFLQFKLVTKSIDNFHILQPKPWTRHKGSFVK